MTTFSDTTECDAAFIASQKAKRAAVTNLKRLMALHETIVPARTFYDEWKKTVAGIPDPEISADTKKKLATSIKSIEKAHAYLGECETAEVVAKQVQKEKRQAFAVALMAWARIDGSPKSVGDLVKARSKIETEQKLANLAAGMPADYVEHRQSTVGPSHIDRVKAGSKGGHSVNFGHNQNRLRGATVKLASER